MVAHQGTILNANTRRLRMARGARWIGYTFFVVVLVGVSLYLCFPSELLRDYLQRSTARLAPDVFLRIRAVEPALPFGLELADAWVGLSRRPGAPVFRADRLWVGPSLRTLSLMRPAIRFDCEAYGGKIKGVVGLREFRWGGPIRSNIGITSLRLEEYPNLQEWLQGDLTGTMSGKVVYVGAPGDLLHGSGEVELSILDGTYRFPEPFLGMEAVEFDRIDTQMVFEEEKISLARFDFQGEEMEGTASGVIHLHPNIAQSTLDLKVSLRAFSTFLTKKGVFTIAIRGTLEQPRISFI